MSLTGSTLYSPWAGKCPPLAALLISAQSFREPGPFRPRRCFRAGRQRTRQRTRRALVRRLRWQYVHDAEQVVRAECRQSLCVESRGWRVAPPRSAPAAHDEPGAQRPARHIFREVLCMLCLMFSSRSPNKWGLLVKVIDLFYMNEQHSLCVPRRSARDGSHTHRDSERDFAITTLRFLSQFRISWPSLPPPSW